MAVHEVSWYRPHLDLSLKLIQDAAPDTGSALIDVGGGEATLVDDLVARRRAGGGSQSAGGVRTTRWASRPRDRARARSRDRSAWGTSASRCQIHQSDLLGRDRIAQR